MAKPKSGYKRPFHYQPPPGVKIEVRTQEVWQLLLKVAKRNHCTVSQLGERYIRYALTGEPYIPPPRLIRPATPTKRPRHFQLPESVYEEVERQHGEDKAMDWIKKTILSFAQIEETAMVGEQVEHEWRERYRI